MNYTAVALMPIFLLLLFLLVKTFLKKVIYVKTKEMRVPSEIIEAVLQMSLLIQPSGFTGQTRGSGGGSVCSCRRAAAAAGAAPLLSAW